ncbi:hypothetical protein [Bradyrhizobium sp. Arg816]|uniref:hypothetical protein n=1 Tax=Bradyrhizobium sp. Arg816 TaxID=2998491 RepID=UPI00249DBDB3|nr:hypothetical protein [Bradyrhizobium sp. Arg816]MDI3563555.1 hypothetical protein [Bradyrhizobium sp. Arg816]
MALTANTIPSQITTFPCPYDAMLAFCSAQTLTATGYFNNLNSGQIDLGGSAPVSAAGRTDFIWSMDITACDFSSADESYKLHLFGSNDVAFGNGNVELLAFHDLAAVTAGRQVATILGASPTIPPTNLGGTIIQLPATNLMQRIYYRYLRMYLVAAGTTPSITLTSWISRANVNF